MKKYMLLLFILLVALLTSCNLDNQGIFAEVLDRVPSDNRRISLIGINSNGNDVYFSSVNGIESYNLVSGVYTTIDGSAEAKKSNRFIFDIDNNQIIYFVESANSITPKYDEYYSITITTDENNKTTYEKKSLDGSANTDIFCGAFDKYLINKNGDVVSTSIDANNKLTFNKVATAPQETRFIKNIDDILVYTTSASGIPDSSSLVYYYFDDTKLNKIGSNLGDLRSVAKDDSYTVLTFSKSNEGTSFYKLEGNQLSKIYSFSTVYQKDFASFIDNGNLYYAYDGSSSFNKLPLNGGTISSTTISKISTVSIIGYFKVGDNYKICTTNNGFFTLSVSGTPTIL